MLHAELITLVNFKSHQDSACLNHLTKSEKLIYNNQLEVWRLVTAARACYNPQSLFLLPVCGL